MADDGFILLARRFFDHPYWTKPRKFSEAEAWIDMIGMASFRSRQVLLGSVRIELGRGEFHAATRYLERRWGWGLRQVHDFLHGAIDAGEIACVKETPRGNAYRIVNYETYQSVGNAKRKRSGNDSETNNKEGKEGNEGKASTVVDGWVGEACGIWCDEFGGTAPAARIKRALAPLVKKYGKDEVLPVFRKYVQTKDAEYATAEDFANKYGPWKEGKVKQAKQQPQQFDYSNATKQFKGFTK